MKFSRTLLVLLTLFSPFVLFGQSTSTLKVDRSRSFIEVDVDATKDFTARLDAYDLVVTLDAAQKVKSAVLTFKFANLKTSDAKRDADMIEWLGGGDPEGRFELGNLAQVPNGQGQASGRLSFHGAVQRVEMPITFSREGNDFTISGQTTIDYRQWKLPKIRKALLFSVDPEVKIRFKISGTVVPVPDAK